VIELIVKEDTMNKLLNKMGLDSAGLGFMLYGFAIVYMGVVTGIFNWHLLWVGSTKELLWSIPGVVLAALGIYFLIRGGYRLRPIPWPWKRKYVDYEDSEDDFSEAEDEDYE